MQDYSYFLIGSFLIYTNYFILGSILHKKITNSIDYITLNETTLISLISLSILGFILNFFFSLNETLNFTIFILNLFLIFLVDKENIYKILKKSFIFVLILIIVISFSRNPEDSNLYHNSYIALINSDKISFGISNLHFRFGHTAFIQYLSALSYIPKISEHLIIIQNNFIYCLLLSIFFKFFKNSLIKQDYFLSSFNALALLFFTLKFSKHSDWGIDLNPALLTVYLCSLFIFLSKKKISDVSFKFLLIHIGLVIIFVIFNRTTYAFLILLPFVFLFLHKIHVKQLIQLKPILFFFVIIMLYFLKNFINTSCLLYPFYLTCFETSWSSELIEHLNYKQIYFQSKAWSMGFPDSVVKFNEELYVKNFNWLDAWLSVHFLKIIEKILPFVILVSFIFLILHFYLPNKKKIEKKNFFKKEYIYLIIFFSISTFFWFLNFPLYRYGAGFIITLTILIASGLFSKIFQNKNYKISFMVAFFLVTPLLILSLKNIQRIIKEDQNPLLPLTFKNEEIKSKKIDANTIYFYNSFDLCYYPYSSPCVKDNTDFIKNIKIIKGYKFYLTK
jgi:hypothetical protein